MWATSSRSVRVPVLVDTTSGSVKPEIRIREYIAGFWEHVQSDGYDVLFYVEPDPLTAGFSPLAHFRDAWNYGTRQATFITNTVAAPTAGSAAIIWAYIGASSAVVSDPSTSQTATGDGRAFAAIDTAGLTVLTGRLDDSGAPIDTVVVPVGASVMVVLPLSRLGDPTVGTIQGRRIGQEPSGVVVEVLDADADGAPATPGNWTSTAGCAVTWREDLDGLALLIPLSPDEACDALLRVRVLYPIGTELRHYARVRAVTPTE